MIAIPVARRDGGELKNLNLFTRAKLIALVDANDTTEVLEHEHSSGKTLALDLIERGVKVLITDHMGQTPYDLLSAAGVELVYRKGSTEIGELLELYRAGKLDALTPDMVHASKHQHHHGEHAHDCDCGH